MQFCDCARGCGKSAEMGNVNLEHANQNMKNERYLNMKRLVIALFTCASLLCPILLSNSNLSTGAANATNEKVLALTIDGDLFDAAEVLLSSRGVRVRNHLGMSCWFPEKPSTIYLLNPENQTYFAQPASEYINELRREYRPLKYTRLSRKPKTLPDGTKAEMVTVFNSGPDKKEEIVAEVTCLRNTNLPPAVHRIWCAYMGLPEKDFALPIGSFQNVTKIRHMREAFSGGGRKRWLCVALPKRVTTKTMDDKLLKLPTNYKEAKDKASLYLSTDGNLQEKDLEDFFMSAPRKKKEANSR